MDTRRISIVGKYHCCAIRLLGSLLAYRTRGRNRGQPHTDGHFHSPMKLTIPELAVVALVGPSGSGKSSFARKHFRPTEGLSSDFCRGLGSDEENSQAATNDAFEVLYFIASQRLTTGKRLVIVPSKDQAEAGKPIIAVHGTFN